MRRERLIRPTQSDKTVSIISDTVLHIKRTQRTPQRHNKAINGERDKRNALNQLQEVLIAISATTKAVINPTANMGYRRLSGSPSFCRDRAPLRHHHRHRQQERKLGSSVTAHPISIPPEMVAPEREKPGHSASTGSNQS